MKKNLKIKKKTIFYVTNKINGFKLTLIKFSAFFVYGNNFQYKTKINEM